MLEVTFIFGDRSIPVDIKIETEVSEENGIIKKGSFRAMDYQTLEEILMNNGVEPRENIGISHGQQGLELVIQVPTEDKLLETFGSFSAQHLAINYYNGLLENFKLHFEDWLEENKLNGVDLELEEYEFKFDMEMEGEEEE